MWASRCAAVERSRSGEAGAGESKSRQGAGEARDTLAGVGIQVGGQCCTVLCGKEGAGQGKPGAMAGEARGVGDNTGRACRAGGGCKYQPKLNQNQRKRECRQRR